MGYIHLVYKLHYASVHLVPFQQTCLRNSGFSINIVCKMESSFLCALSLLTAPDLVASFNLVLHFKFFKNVVLLRLQLKENFIVKYYHYSPSSYNIKTVV
jgi:hypothetical protein